MITFGYVSPLLVEYSSFTLAMLPPFVHVMFCTASTIHVSPPFGTPSTREPLMVKSASDSSSTSESAPLITFTRH